ncbi:hypothetical protein KKF81_02115 [Candidatus Micrarchaeota archaeon]|nr:hypothetical protein [Candidatus Micrarchaeota archaeon]MBU1165716.1 hypothetical protein [Candidatus Micrarchaeota archaeon]MBU1887083.1 hypothetical protein [Candidatus Micrarchaeota archaeon]
MGIYSILEKLRKCERKVFTTNDIAITASLSNTSARVYVNRMIKKGLLKRVEAGKYTISEDPFVVASQLISPSYISFFTAFYLLKMVPQEITKITIATSKRKKPINVLGMNVEFIQIKKSMMFGFRKTRLISGNSYIMLADPEKAAVDALYRPGTMPISYLKDLLKMLNVKKLEEYSLRTGSEAVLRRMGFLLDNCGIPHSLKPKSKNIYFLNPKIHCKGKLDRKWRLHVNEVI